MAQHIFPWLNDALGTLLQKHNISPIVVKNTNHLLHSRSHPGTLRFGFSAEELIFWLLEPLPGLPWGCERESKVLRLQNI